MKKLKLTTALFLSLGVVFAQETTVKKSFSDVEELSFETASGNCTVSKSEGSTIEVEVTYFYDKDEYEPVFEQRGSDLRIEEDYKKNNVSGKSPIWTISLPSGLEADFNIGSGDLKITAIEFEEINGNLGSGDMDLRDLAGEATINVGSGDLDISNFKGDIKAVTGSGDININTAKGDFSVIAGSGQISLETCKGGFEVINGSGDIETNDLMIKSSSSFISGSGDAEINLSRELMADISIISGSGDAVLDFNGTPINGMITMKANKQNGDIDAPFDFTSETEERDGKNTVMVKTVKKGSGDFDIDITTGSGEAAIKE